MGKIGEAEFEENPPDPAATIEALRSLGYSTEAAIADLIDNSVAAGATKVHVRMRWDGPNTWCSVTDNGGGMSATELVAAMRIGAKDPLGERGKSDLGRFGLGLKTASFSQARELTVASRRAARGELQIRVWDLDHVRQRGRWEMRRSATAMTAPLIKEALGARVGTTVLWRHLTRVITSIEESDEEAAKDDFFHDIEAVDRHLGMTFGRLVASKALTITLNGHTVVSWDPFLADHPATQQLSPETLRFKGYQVHVRPYVLPHRSKLSEVQLLEAAGPLGWNAHQGYYVYRRDRLIAAGDWLGMKLTRSDEFNLARLAIDIPAELDHDWGLDVKKTSVIPPRPLAKDLRRLAEMTRRAAKKALTSRGTELKPRDGRAAVQTVWTQKRTKEDLDFQINRRHPLVESVLRSVGPAKRSVENLIRVIEQTIPAPYLSAAAQTKRPPLDDENAGLLYSLAEVAFNEYLGQGKSRADAIELLARTEPFDQHPSIIEELVSKP